MTTPTEVQPKVWCHINGTQDQMFDRFCISELCKGWPVYRDTSEWNNYRDLFLNDAYVWTTWGGATHIDQFIEKSKEGKAKGDFIMHRENGTLVDISGDRGIGKMKATITQRFTVQECPVDIECDCRFIFFVQKLTNIGWKIKYVKLFYEKDRCIPVDPNKIPKFDEQELEKYPEGYKYLGYAQRTLGHEILLGLPTLYNKGFTKMYEMMQKWLEREEIDLFWEDKRHTDGKN